MDRPQAQASSKAVQPPPRRRIVPVAVAPQDQAPPLAAFDAEQPLVVPPPPAQGSSKHISASGQGRRIWVDIHSSIEVKFKEVLRQQGLDYKTWRANMQQRRAQQDTAAGAQGGDARRHGLSAAGVYQRTQGMYEVLTDDESEGDEEDDDEDDSGSEGPAAEGGGEEGDAAGSSGDNDEEDDEDDEEDDKGNDTAGEVDLEKEEAAARKAAKPRRQRFERYDDDFIDDSELEMVKGGGPTKTKFSGFYVTQGNVETIEEPSKPRAKPKPRQPKNPDAAAAAAGGSGPGRKRKQPEKAPEQEQQQQQQQQQQKKKQQQQDADAGAACGKKKRQRSETPASGAAAAAAQDKPPAGKKAKPSPAPLPAAAAAAAQQQPAAIGYVGADPAAAAAAAAGAVAGGGTAAKAMAGIAAALAAKKKPPAGDSKALAAAAAAPVPPSAADNSKPREQQQQTAVNKDGQQLAEQSAAAPGPVAAAASAAEPAVDAAEAAAAAAAGGAVRAAVAAGLPAEVIAAVEALQKEVAEHKPPAPGGPGKSAAMSKAVRHALDGLGLAFTRLPTQEQQQQTASLLSAVGPLMLPYCKEKKLRRILLEEAASRAGELQDTRQALFKQLEACGPAGGAAGAGGAGDEDFQPHMSAAAEEALVAAWAAHQGSPEQLNQLAVDVCAQLGWANVQPDKAVAELKQIIKQAKKRASKSKAATTPAAAARALSQQPSLQRQLSGGINSSRQSPEPSATTAAAAAGDTSGGGTPGLTPQRQQQQQQVGLAPLALAAQAHSGGAAGSGTQKQPVEKFSTISAPSPRLQRCLDAAVAAGAPLEWLQERYPSLRGKHMHQMFRTLCMSGPAGCTLKAMVGCAAEHDLNAAWEDSTATRSALKQSLAGNAMSSVAGTTEADPKAYALLCFPGVRKQPAKPPKAAPEAAAAGQPAAE